MSETTPAILWRPTKELIRKSNLLRFQRQIEERHGVALEDYQALHHWSVTQIKDFWHAVWECCEVVARETPKIVLENPGSILDAIWFPDARLNMAENLLRFRDSQTALIAVSESGHRETISYEDLFTRTQAFAAGLNAVGVKVGDRVGGVMPNVIDTVVAMLGTLSLGAVWTCCSPDFGVTGILDRFGQTRPKVLVGCESYFYNGKLQNCEDKLMAVADALPEVVALVISGTAPVGDAAEQKTTHRHGYIRLSFSSFSQLASRPLEFQQLPFDHPIYILYSSGTTGKPKCIVHGAGGTLLQHLKEYLLHYDVGRGDTFFYYTTTGWTMWNILASALLTGCSVVLYDGSPFFPDANRLINLIDDEGISVFGVSAKYLSAIEKAGLEPRASHQLDCLRMILSTGSPLSKESYHYVYAKFKEDVCLGSICGGTDIISAFIEATYAMPVHAGLLQCKGLGMAVAIWDEEGNPVVNEKGELVCTAPFPSRPIYFWGDEHRSRYESSYFERFPGVWAQGDFGEETIGGQYIIHGRSDAVLNPGGVRIGTAEIYREVEQIDEVLESVCVGQNWEDDVRVVLFVVLRDGISLDKLLQERIKAMIRSNTTPRHVPARIIQVADIPRTISGKIVEIAVRDAIHGRKVKNIDSLANPGALEIFRNLAKELAA